MSGVRAKFFVADVTKHAGSPGGHVRLSAVSRGDRNAQWASATPSGSMEMTVNNPPAFEFFEQLLDVANRVPGRRPEVFIEIVPATDGWPGDGHAFRPADVDEGHYLHGSCGECGMARDVTINDRGDAAHPNG